MQKSLKNVKKKQKQKQNIKHTHTDTHTQKNPFLRPPPLTPSPYISLKGVFT